MMNSKFFLLTLALASQTLRATPVIDKGYRLPKESIAKDFTLMKLTPEEEYLVKYIIKTNYKIPKEEAQLIASHILKVSACFNIDPWILTGLIQKESSFKRDAVSSTNAAGLTQFTSLGFKEVHDQLGFRGREGASESSITYFNSKINECIDSEWKDLWEKVGVAEDHPEFYNLLKEELKNDVNVAVTYGAILLKTYVAYIDIKNTRNNVELPTSEIYFQALQIYNGEEGDAKVKYAKAIFQNLKNLYPNEVDFPFLAD